jgi:hypothetical protein
VRERLEARRDARLGTELESPPDSPPLGGGASTGISLADITTLGAWRSGSGGGGGGGGAPRATHTRGIPMESIDGWRRQAGLTGGTFFLISQLALEYL